MRTFITCLLMFIGILGASLQSCHSSKQFHRKGKIKKGRGLPCPVKDC